MLPLRLSYLLQAQVDQREPDLNEGSRQRIQVHSLSKAEASDNLLRRVCITPADRTEAWATITTAHINEHQQHRIDLSSAATSRMQNAPCDKARQGDVGPTCTLSCLADPGSARARKGSSFCNSSSQNHRCTSHYKGLRCLKEKASRALEKQVERCSEGVLREMAGNGTYCTFLHFADHPLLRPCEAVSLNDALKR